MPEPSTTPPPRKCPVCGKPAAERFRPFCSRRCADVDLNRWLSDRYTIPAEREEAEEEAADKASSAEDED